MELRNKTAIAGAANTTFSFASLRSPESLAVEAITKAAADAGLPVDEIDGIVGHTFDSVREYSIINNLGLRHVSFFAETPYGNACGAVGLAAMAVATGRARNVVAFRAVKAHTGHTYQNEGSLDSIGPNLYGDRSFYAPFGLLAVLHWASLIAQRYVYKYACSPEVFGWIAVACRAHASTNPEALYYRQGISIEDYRRSPIVARPLRTLDGNVGNDGASAVLVTSSERARDLPQRPIHIAAASWSANAPLEVVTNYQAPDIVSAEESRLLAATLTQEAGIDLADVDFVQIYDHVTALVLTSLEALGFCEPGEGADLVSGAQKIMVGGSLPVNTHGGHLGEAYVQTMNHIVEAVRQLRGQAANQVRDAEVGMIVGGEYRSHYWSDSDQLARESDHESRYPPGPVPVADAENKAYWESAASERLAVQRCDACGMMRFPPQPLCPRCRHDRHTWAPVSGRGTIYSYTVIPLAVHSRLQEAVPYNVVLVELEEGPRIVSNVVDTPDDELFIGMPVQIVYGHVGDGATLPRFKPMTD